MSGFGRGDGGGGQRGRGADAEQSGADNARPESRLRRSSLRQVLSAATPISEPPTGPALDEPSDNRTYELTPSRRVGDDDGGDGALEPVRREVTAAAPFVDRREQAGAGPAAVGEPAASASREPVREGTADAVGDAGSTGPQRSEAAEGEPASPRQGTAGGQTMPEGYANASTQASVAQTPSPNSAPGMVDRADSGSPGGQDNTMTDPKTQMVRGPQRPTRTDFLQEPVVGWLVVIGGPGLGAFRPLFEGNNTIGRSQTQRVPIDFGDDTISSEEQAFIRYDASDREFLFVPNLAKTNVVSINEIKPTSAVKLSAMDVVTMGQTQLVFVPFCGEDFDWSELADLEG